MGRLSELMETQLKRDERIDYLQRSFSAEEQEQAEQKKFDFSSYGGEAEINAMIERYQQEGEVSEERKRQLLEHLPPVPEFEVLTEEAYGKLGFFKKRKYNGQVSDYRKVKAKWYESDKGKKLATRVYDVAFDQKADRRRKEAADVRDQKLATHRQAGLFQEIPRDPALWDREFQRLHSQGKDSPEYKAEKEVGLHEARSVTLMDMAGEQAIQLYSGDQYGPMNKFLRTGERTGLVPNMLPKYCDDAKAALSRARLSRDLICRRGVKDVNVAATMLGINPAGMGPQEIRQAVESAIAVAQSKNDFVTLVDEGFVSASLPGADNLFSAGPGIGIEFIILAKKGTQALDINAGRLATKGDMENELLFNAGTKFRLVKAEFEPPATGEGKVIYGNSHSWKFYLESVPAEEEGVRRTTTTGSQPASDAQ